MSVQVDEAIVPTNLGTNQPEIWHLYPSRLFVGLPPKIGDRALCGNLKTGDVTWETAGNVSYQECAVCVDLYRGLVS